MSKFVLVKCLYPEHYDAADHAVIEVTEELILTLDKRLAQARAMWEEGFFGTKWWDYTPDFIPCGGPDTVGLDSMSEDDFEHALESNSYVCLRDNFERPDDYAPMSPVTLTVCASKTGSQKAIGGFYWTGTDKYIGALGRVETYEMHEEVLDEWAELIGCTETLAKVRCRGAKSSMKYVVEVLEIHRSTCEVESETPMDRAALLKKAGEMIEAGEQSDYLAYDRTMESENWITRTENGDFVT